MNGWIEIFRAGEHVDNGGQRRAWTEDELAAIAASYDPDWHEAPLVVGHPATDAPAYGWVEALKTEGGRLLAKFREVSDDFRALVREGRFKKRSVALYPDLDGRGLYLRHVGFLGAAPPAVKGLRPVPAFGAAAFAEFDFPDSKSGKEETEMDEQKFQGMFETFAEKVSEKVSAAIAKLRPAAGSDGGDKDPAAALRAEFAEQITALKEEFSEQVTALEADKKRISDALAAAQSRTSSGEVRQFVERLRGQGKWAPAWDDAGLPEFMESLTGSPEIEFAEGAGEAAKKVKKTPLAVFQGFIEGLPKVVEFGELTAKAGARPSKVLRFTEDPGRVIENVDLAELTRKIQLEKEVSFDEAAQLAQAQLAG